MNISCPWSLSELIAVLNDADRKAHHGAQSDWLPVLRELIAEGLVGERRVGRWLPHVAVFSQVFARKALRRRGAYVPLVWSQQFEKFGHAAPFDMTRMMHPGKHSPLDLCEQLRLLPDESQDLLHHCLSSVRMLFDRPTTSGRAWGTRSAGEVVSDIADALRSASGVAENNWDALWGEAHGPAAPRLAGQEIEAEIRRVLGKKRGQSELYWLTESKTELPDREGLVFVIESLGGKRNFHRRLTFYTDRRRRRLGDALARGIHLRSGLCWRLRTQREAPLPWRSRRWRWGGVD
jgi:hypothetical protein